MSLLMDALKRAEASKKTSGDDPSAPPSRRDDTSPLSLEALPDQESTGDRSAQLPELSSHLESVDADLEAEADTPDNRRPHKKQEVSEENQRQLAKKVIALKDNAAIPGVWRRRAPFLAVTGALCLAGAGAGYYFWNELERLTKPANGLAVRPAVRGAEALASRPIVAPPIAPAPLDSPVQGVAENSPAAEAPPAADSSLGTATPLPPPTASPPTVSPAKPTQAAEAAPEPRLFRSSRTPVTVTPKREMPRSASDMTQLAFQALDTGNRDIAAQHYQQALALDPRYVDALVGLASLAAAGGDTQGAESYYLRAIEADPKNAVAQSGLINLHGKRDPAFAESRLKVLAAALPAGSPALGSVLFALGNLYSAQSRWNEAQRAYFEAHGADASNPDYQINLAIALEHLQKPSLALNFYRGALLAAEKRPASFDRQQVRERIDVLQSIAR
jgi:tetratricopeptide (TPR) repeat protein